MLNDVTRCDSDLETLGLLLNRVNMNKIILLGVYRPPSGSASIAISKLNTLCEELMGQYKNADIYIMGDFNVNLLEQTTLAIRVKEFCATFSLYSLINRPTRYAMSTHSQTFVLLTVGLYLGLEL